MRQIGTAVMAAVVAVTVATSASAQTLADAARQQGQQAGQLTPAQTVVLDEAHRQEIMGWGFIAGGAVMNLLSITTLANKEVACFGYGFYASCTETKSINWNVWAVGLAADVTGVLYIHNAKAKRRQVIPGVAPLITQTTRGAQATWNF